MNGSPWMFVFGEHELSVKEPVLLWGLLSCVVLVGSVLSSRAWLPRGASWISLLIRLAFLASLVLTASSVTLVSPSDRICVSVLLDASDSMDPAALRAGEELGRELIRRKRAQDTVSVIAFGGKPRELTGAFGGPEGEGRPDVWSRVEPQATDLASAVRLAGASFAEDCSPRLLLVSDERETRGDASAALDHELQSLKAQNRPPPRIARLHVDGSPSVDVAISGFSLPEQIRVFEASAFRVRLRATGQAEGRLAVRFSSAGWEKTLEQPVEVSRGDSSLEFSAVPEVAGEMKVEATWLSPSADRFAENDRAAIVTTVLGPPEVLIVDPNPGDVSALASALRAQKFEVRTAEPRALPSRAEDLEKYAFVIVSDVPRGAFPQGAEAALGEMVRSGSGLLVTSGARSRGTMEGSALERILPLRAEGRDQERSAGVAMVLAIDRSGSMSGTPLEMAKAACRATLGTLEATDWLEVIAFDGKPTRAVPMQPVRLRASMDTSIARIQPGGGTEILASLDMAYQDLARARARRKHIVLLTDGNADSDGIFEVASSAFTDGITVTTVGLGSGVNEALLKSIAEAGGGRFHAVSDPSTLPRIFVRETELAMQDDPAEEFLSLQVLEEAEFLRGTGIRAAPPLRGAEPMRLAPRPARALLALDNGDPLLAEMPLGLGKTMVWASDLKGGWGTGFLRWSGFPKFIGQLVRAHQRSDDSQIWPMDVSFHENQLTASLDAPLDGDRFDNSLVSVLTAVRADDPSAQGTDARRVRAPFELKGPGHYEARLELPAVGTYLLRASHRSERRGVEARSFQAVAHPYPEEYVDVRDPTDELSSLASLGRPTQPTAAALLSPSSDGARARRDLRDWLLSAAACLLVLDIFVRRIGSRVGVGEAKRE